MGIPFGVDAAAPHVYLAAAGRMKVRMYEGIMSPLTFMIGVDVNDTLLLLFGHSHVFPFCCVALSFGISRIMAESIAERKRRVDEERAQLRVDMKLCKQQSAALARDWVLKEDMRAIAICIYILAKQELEPLVAYLKGVGRMWHFSNLEDDELAFFAVDLVSHASDYEMHAFTNPALTPFPESLVKAHSLVHAWRAKAWTSKQNLDGHNLASPVIHMHAERELKRIPPAVRPDSWGPPSTNRSKMVMARLRRKYNGRFGQLPMVCELGREEMRAKAFAVWQWYNYYYSQRPSGKAILHINWDETAICLHQSDKKGNIFLAKGHDAVQRVSHGARRAYLTHVALICDNPLIQKSLPQIVICNEKTLPAKMHAALQEHLGENIILLRRKSAWVNAETCLDILRLIHEALVPFAHQWQAILLLDALKSHIGIRMFNAGARYKIWILVIAAGMTWLLQVLDTHGFRSYKSHLRNAYQLHYIDRGLETNKLELLLDAVKDAIDAKIVDKDWCPAFAENGFGPCQHALRDAIKRKLALGTPINIPASKPSEDQVKVCFPKKTKVPYNAIWRTVESTALPTPMLSLLALPAASSSSSSSSSAPIASRTRANTKLKPT